VILERISQVISYHIDEQLGLVEIGGEESSPEDFARVVAAVMADPKFQLGFGFLRDRRGSSPGPVGLVRRRVICEPWRAAVGRSWSTSTI
jgi:hypothetical protein